MKHDNISFRNSKRKPTCTQSISPKLRFKKSDQIFQNIVPLYKKNSK